MPTTCLSSRLCTGRATDVVANARAGQTIILTSTTYVGTTAELLAEPLRRRGLEPGEDIYVAFSPERIDPGNPDHLHEETPRVVGGMTPECATRAAGIISLLTSEVYVVSSAEAAEATKLYENIFRAVSLALANEFADACGALCAGPDRGHARRGHQAVRIPGHLPRAGRRRSLHPV